MTGDHLERMRAIIAQAVAQAQTGGSPLQEVCLILYAGFDEAEARRLFEVASRDTLAQGARLVIERVGSRYICWNCCGLRFESDDGLCPNCGELSFEVPEEIAFGLQEVRSGSFWGG